MVNKPLIRPYFWGGTLGGARLTSHEFSSFQEHGGFFVFFGGWIAGFVGGAHGGC